MRTFCTIISPDYFPYALTLYKSLADLNANEHLHILLTEKNGQLTSGKHPSIHITSIEEILEFAPAKKIYERYAETDDKFRWALKPVFILWLLERGYDKVIYTDCDVYFYNEYEFLFGELDLHNVILFPNWRAHSPAENEDEFYALFTIGQFSAGTIGASNKGWDAISWWADVCHFKIEQQNEKGLFDDMRYLDALPTYYDNIGIIKHRGCNIGFWNQDECKRVNVNGETRINGDYPIIFIHFTTRSIPRIVNGEDTLLYPYLEKYEQAFQQNGHSLKEYIVDFPGTLALGYLTKTKRKLLLRTRLRKFLLKLVNKL